MNQPTTYRGRSESISDNEDTEREAALSEFLQTIAQEHSLPQSSVERLRLFITSGCCPLPPKIETALDAVLQAVSRVRLLDSKTKYDPRRLKRYDEINRSVKSLRSLVQTMSSIGIAPVGMDSYVADGINLSCPLYVCLDLGLRQRRRHFTQLFFQAFVLPAKYRTELKRTTSSSSSNPEPHHEGMKVAEGGRYDDLVSCSPMACLCVCLWLRKFFRSEDTVLLATLVQLCSVSTPMLPYRR